MSALACLAERGFFKLKGVFLQVGFEARQHAHSICRNLLFWLPRCAANSLLLAHWAKLGSHGTVNCMDAITSGLSDVWSPLLSFFSRFFAIVARGFIFILEIICAPFEALVAVLMSKVEAERCTDTSFIVLKRVFSEKLCWLVYKLALSARFGTAWVLLLLRGMILGAFWNSRLARRLHRLLRAIKTVPFLLTLALHLLLFKDFGTAAGPHCYGRTFIAMILFFRSGCDFVSILAQAFGIHLREKIAGLAIGPISLRRKLLTNMLRGVLDVCKALQLDLGKRPVESAI